MRFPNSQWTQWLSVKRSVAADPVATRRVEGLNFTPNDRREKVPNQHEDRTKDSATPIGYTTETAN